jgi:hypothetical protein
MVLQFPYRIVPHYEKNPPLQRRMDSGAEDLPLPQRMDSNPALVEFLSSPYRRHLSYQDWRLIQSHGVVVWPTGDRRLALLSTEKLNDVLKAVTPNPRVTVPQYRNAVSQDDGPIRQEDAGPVGHGVVSLPQARDSVLQYHEQTTDLVDHLYRIEDPAPYATARFPVPAVHPDPSAVPLDIIQSSSTLGISSSDVVQRDDEISATTDNINESTDDIAAITQTVDEVEGTAVLSESIGDMQADGEVETTAASWYNDNIRESAGDKAGEETTDKDRRPTMIAVVTEAEGEVDMTTTAVPPAEANDDDNEVLGKPIGEVLILPDF